MDAAHALELTGTRLSAIDEERFGVRTARADELTLESLEAVLAFCSDNDVELLIGRCATTELRTVQAMERADFLLTDTLVHWTRSLEHPLKDEPQLQIRELRPEDEAAIEHVATESFRGYYGHYHADPRLDNSLCDEGYVSWAVRSCRSKEVAEHVLVAELDGVVVGYMTFHHPTSEDGEAIIGGVLPTARRFGGYRSLLAQGSNWCRATGSARMLVSTQVTNVAVQKVWARQGFEPSHSSYTLHKWFF